ncbi:MAG TPA: hypothetical protein VGG03_01415 [Thermoanaerobaculia bacterium]|jgi:hypothetical protein
MPEINAYAKVFRDWEGLLGACDRNGELLPGVEPMKEEMKTFLAQARELKLDQENLEGQRLAATQRLVKLVDDGREMARKLRNFVKSRLGTRSELLQQFGIPPNRSRPRKAKKPQTPTPAPEGATNPPAMTKPAE